MEAVGRHAGRVRSEGQEPSRHTDCHRAQQDGDRFARVVVNIGLAEQVRGDTYAPAGCGQSRRRIAPPLAFGWRQASAAQWSPAVSSRTEDGFGWLSKGVPVQSPIIEFLTDFRNHPGALLTDVARPIRRYIEERQDDELAEWDVSVLQRRSRERRALIDR